MINFLKQYLADGHFKKEIEPRHISIVKTQNGSGHPDKKIVFYVFKKNHLEPSLIIYAARNRRVNDVLKKSIKNNQENSEVSPKVLFEDYYNDVYFVGMEFLRGSKLDLSSQADMSLAFEYLINRYKENKDNDSKSIKEFYQEIKDRFFRIDIDIDALIGDKINNFKDTKWPVIKQHGDFQDNNIFIVNHKLKVIDWDDFGEIDLPIFDFCTLYLKYKKKVGHDSFIGSQWMDFAKQGNFEEVDKNASLIFHYLYNFLRKDKLHNRFERAKHYRKLVKDLEKIK